MILKKYRIVKIGALNVVYKRTRIQNTATQDDKCVLCGVGLEKCKTLVVYTSSSGIVRTYRSLCYGLELVKRSNKFVTKNNITYIPWKIR